MDRAIGPHLPFLQLLCTANTKQRKALLDTITGDQLRSLCELVLNIYYGNLNVPKNYVKQLYPHKKFVQCLVERTYKNNYKKRMLAKNTNILPVLLKPFVLSNFIRNGQRIHSATQRKVRELDKTPKE